MTTTPPEDQGFDVTADNVAEFHQLLPIPTTELQANPNMEQNPGY